MNVGTVTLMNGQWVIERQLTSDEVLQLLNDSGALQAAEDLFDEPFDPNAVVDVDELFAHLD